MLTKTLPPTVPQKLLKVFSEHATHSHDQASRRDGAVLLTEPASYQLHWPGVRVNNSWQLRRLSKPRRGPDLSKANKTVCKYDRPKHKQGDVSAEVEGKTGANHEQHQAQQRFSLLPPANEQPSPNRHQYAGCYWAKDLAKVQNAAADHSGGNSRVHTQVPFVTLEPAPHRVVNSEQRL